MRACCGRRRGSPSRRGGERVAEGRSKGDPRRAGEAAPAADGVKGSREGVRGGKPQAGPAERGKAGQVEAGAVRCAPSCRDRSWRSLVGAGWGRAARPAFVFLA